MYRLPRTRKGRARVLPAFILCLFSESCEWDAPAGLLTYSPGFAGLPIRKDSDAWWRKGKNELTAAGTVQEFHLIPF